MRLALITALIPVLGVTYLACGGQGSTPDFGDGGTSSGSGGGSGGGSGSSSGTSGGSSGSSSGGNTDGGGSSSGGGSSGGSSGSGSGGTCTTNPAVTGTVTNTGGSVSRLLFAAVGDTRPATEGDTAGYPTGVITKIYQDLQAQNPRPSLVVGTGDYQFAQVTSSEGQAQLQAYMTARGSYGGAFFPAMGNHDCGVASGCSTSDNCNCVSGQGGTSSGNFQAFLSEMIQPIGQSKPYYSINVNAADNSWTAKFVITAANAWDSAQQSWLQSTLAQKTTYTFVVRHEPTDTAANDVPPGVAGVDALLTQNPYTLLIVGHTHNYGHWTSYFSGTYACGSNCPPASKAVVVGNGGAPLSSSKYNYGYAMFSQRCDGAIVADEYDYMTGATDSYFHFVVTPDGTITH